MTALFYPLPCVAHFPQAVVEVCDATVTKIREPINEGDQTVYQNLGGTANRRKDRLSNILPSTW